MYNYNILFYLYHKENHSLYIQPIFLIKDITYLNTKVKNPNIQEDVGEEDLPELEIDESIEKTRGMALIETNNWYGSGGTAGINENYPIMYRKNIFGRRNQRYQS